MSCEFTQVNCMKPIQNRGSPSLLGTGISMRVLEQSAGVWQMYCAAATCFIFLLAVYLSKGQFTPTLRFCFLTARLNTMKE